MAGNDAHIVNAIKRFQEIVFPNIWLIIGRPSLMMHFIKSCRLHDISGMGRFAARTLSIMVSRSRHKDGLTLQKEMLILFP